MSISRCSRCQSERVHCWRQHAHYFRVLKGDGIVAKGEIIEAMVAYYHCRGCGLAWLELPPLENVEHIGETMKEGNW